MEYLKGEPSTPRFGNNTRIRKASSGSTKYEEIKEKHKSVNEKSRNKSKEGNKNNSKEKTKNKNKSKSKEKNKNKLKSLNSKNKHISEAPLPGKQKHENLYDNFLKKRIKLRNDFDQNNSDKFLLEKELAFQQFRINENADFLDN